MTTPDDRPDEATLDFLRSAFPAEWREPVLGHDGVAAWEAENRVTLPEPYRTFIAEIGNGSGLGPPEDEGLQPLGWLPECWPGTGPRRPGEQFPLEEAWVREEDETIDAYDPRVDAVFNHGSVVRGAEDGPSFWLLVTTGPRRGEVWMVSDVGAVPTPTAEARRFDGWVRHWHAGNDSLA
ncbi:SMI1/KNR4 family protein [Kitasatospora sp. NPDC056783]|uniref:SMI1/KNR4 family protein n=1 Tax=Kitasatospora sp. NPDC056783 TaxID=3345943 RepID=UPI00368BDEB7